MIVIRADANAKIGTGHVMRCLAIAAALKTLGKEVCFIGADAETADFLAKRDWQCLVLHSAYDRLEEELPLLTSLLLEKKAEVLLVDSYFVTEKYFQTLKKQVKTVYMDDLFSFPYPVDALVNYNIYGALLPYEKEMPETELYLGTEFVPLRQEFQNTEYAVRENATQVLITTGGSDRYNLAGQLLETALASAGTENLQFHVVSGSFNKNLPALKEIAEKHKNVQLHCDVKNMAELMLGCDIAVTAGGSTVYELCAVGVPVLCFSFVDNQEKIVETFAQQELVAFGGNYLKDGSKMLKALTEKLAFLAADKTARESYSKKERSLVDGQGAERIARVLAGGGKITV